MEFAEFHNGLRVLLNIDYPEFEQAVHAGQADLPASLRDDPAEQWPAFRDNPHRWFIRAPTAQALQIWTIVKERGSPCSPTTPTSPA